MTRFLRFFVTLIFSLLFFVHWLFWSHLSVLRQISGDGHTSVTAGCCIPTQVKVVLSTFRNSLLVTKTILILGYDFIDLQQPLPQPRPPVYSASACRVAHGATSIFTCSGKRLVLKSENLSKKYNFFPVMTIRPRPSVTH